MGGGYNLDNLGISGSKAGSNWYVNLGNTYGNMIIQTGYYTTTGSDNYINFPIAFNINYKIFVLHSGTNGLTICEIYTSHNLSRTQIRSVSNSTGTGDSGWIMYWLAIGY